MPDESSTSIRSMLKESIASVEEVVDARWRTMKTRFGWDGQPRIQAYTGYANDHAAWFHGRVLTNPPRDTPSHDNSWWENLLETYNRLESDEVPGVTIAIDFAGTTHHVTSDEEGYFTLESAWHPTERDRTNWKQVAMRIVGHDAITEDESLVLSKLLMPQASAQFGIISDVDDTILQTNVTNLLAMARLTFLHNARTRLPLAGAAAWYHALQTGNDPSTPQQNPIFYVSSSPWNLHDLLEDFLELNDIPDGPILLRDLGFGGNADLVGGHGHKLDKAIRIMAAYPNLPFVLIGDSGQEDASLYAEAATRFADRIHAIFIRDVDPDATTARDGLVQSAIDKATSVGVPMHLIRDSTEAARLSVDLGLIPGSSISAIAERTAYDETKSL